MGRAWRRLAAVLSLAETPIGLGVAPSRVARLAAGVVALAVMTWDLRGAWHHDWNEHLPWARLAAPALALALYAALGARPRTLGLWGVLRPSWGFWAQGIVLLGVVFGVVLTAAFAVLMLVSPELVLFPPHYRGEIEPQRLYEAAVLAPLFEEPVWRLALIPGLVAVFRPWTAVLVGGAGFATLHFCYGNPSPDNFLGGYIFAWVYLKSGSLALPVVLHAAGNICAVVGTSLAWRVLGG